MPADEHDDQPWNQQSGENNAWYGRFCAYLAQGPGRSVRAVYNAERGNTESRAVPESWRKATKRYEWLRRAEAYDAHRRSIVFSTGNALDAQRVTKLDTLIEKLYAQVIENLEALPVDKCLDKLYGAMEHMAKLSAGNVQQRESRGQRGAGGGTTVHVESGDDDAPLRVFVYVPQVADINETLDVPQLGHGDTAGGAGQDTHGGQS